MWILSIVLDVDSNSDLGNCLVPVLAILQSASWPDFASVLCKMWIILTSLPKEWKLKIKIKFWGVFFQLTKPENACIYKEFLFEYRYRGSSLASK